MTTTSILDAAPLNKSEKRKRVPVATRCKIESIFSDTLKRSLKISCMSWRASIRFITVWKALMSWKIPTSPRRNGSCSSGDDPASRMKILSCSSARRLSSAAASLNFYTRSVAELIPNEGRPPRHLLREAVDRAAAGFGSLDK
mgnify:FL=1